jgi:hypothetical protein
MAHLPRYYHKAAALMAVHQSYEAVFFSQFLEVGGPAIIMQERTS